MRTTVVTVLLLLYPNAVAVEPRLRMPDGICESIKLWKQLMRKDYPKADRSVPGAARSCMIPDD